jgi:hypothetical protein
MTRTKKSSSAALGERGQRVSRGMMGLTLWSGLLVAGASCGGDSKPSRPNASDAETEASDDAGADAGQPLYVVAGTIFGTPEVTYIVPTRSLAAGTPIDYPKGLPVVGGAGLYGQEGAGHFFLGSSESPTLTRWEVSPDGKFTQGKAMSLAAHGFSNALVNKGGAVFLSPAKAYFFHQEDLKAVVWNPSSMEIQGTFALPPELNKQGLTLVLDGKAQQRGTELYLVASWADHRNGKYPAGSILVTIDTASNAVLSKEADPRCGQLFDSVRHPSGDIYYGSSAWVAGTHRALGAEFGGEPCILRLRAGQRRFDPDFQIKAQSLVSAQTVGALVAGPPGQAFVRVLDEAIFPVAAGATAKDLSRAEAWRWWRLDLDNMTAAMTDLAPSAAGGTEFTIDGRVFTSLAKKDYSEATLIEMTAAGGPRPGVVLRGYPDNGLRVY